MDLGLSEYERYRIRYIIVAFALVLIGCDAYILYKYVLAFAAFGGLVVLWIVTWPEK